MRPVDRSRNWRALAWALGIMALLGAVATTRHHMQMIESSLHGDFLTWRHALYQEAPHWVFWALAIPLVYLVVDRLARHHWSWPATVFAHVAFAAIAIFLATTWHAIWFSKSFGDALSNTATLSLFSYAAILGAVLAYHYSQLFMDREVELAGAKLSALRAQLRPHFMFNALNSVAMLVRGGRGPEAVEMIARVSDLLRDSLDNDNRAEVSLEEEVALARRYLAVEEVRFADRMEVSVDLTEQAKAARVPRLILQPVVENAVRHGIGARAAAGHLDITGRTTDNELIVVVRDDGPGPGNGHRGNGVGLKNTRERLQTAYGSAARLTLEHGPDGGAVATLVLPLSQ
ncbi:MAG TPA: histidine kinase [Gemmatimonadales bacterium]|nr:histidine kinase [Gemmatimonadales bacterium]